jgi:hypothetical protein
MSERDGDRKPRTERPDETRIHRVPQSPTPPPAPAPIIIPKRREPPPTRN